MIFKNNEQLQEALVFWQKKLRLQDWDILVKVVRSFDFEIKDVAGHCRWTLANKQAFIRLLDPIDYDPSLMWKQDMEVTLVHELLHLPIAVFDKSSSGSTEDLNMEQFVHQLSNALVELKRGQPDG